MNESFPQHEPKVSNGRAGDLQNRLQQLRRRHTRTAGVSEPSNEEFRPKSEVNIALVTLLDIIRKRLWIVVLLSGIVGGLLYQWSRSKPKLYQASAIVEVEIQSPRVFTNIRDVISFNYQVRRFYATQATILRSNTIAKAAIKSASWVLRSPEFYGLGGIKNKAEQRSLMAKMRPNAYTLLKSRTTVSPIRNSSLFRITVTGFNALRTSQLVTAIAESYKEHNLQFRLRATNNAYYKIEKQRDRYAEQYKTLDAQLVRFRQKNNLLTASLTDRRNLAFKRLDEINNRLISVILKRIRLESMLRPFANKKGQRSSTSFFPPLLDHKLYWKMSEVLHSVTLERDKQRARYKDKHPAMAHFSKQIKRLSKILAGQQDLVFESFFQQLAATRREERGLRQKAASARAALQRLERLNLTFARLGEQKAELKKSLSYLNRRFFEIQLLKDSTATNVRFVERPIPPKGPYSPRVFRDTVLGTGLVFVLLLGLFYLLELLDRSIRSMEDVEIKVGLVPLGEIPLFSTKKKQPRDLLYNPDRPLSQIEEAIRTVRTNVLFMTSDLPQRKLLFTSPSPREGKTYVACNMAIGIAHTGKKTILIDTDMRRPRVHKAFQIDYDRSKGASSVMVGQHTLDEAMIDTGFPNLMLLPCGPIPPSPTELLQTEGFFAMLSELESRFEVIIFDSPPINHVADAAVLADYVDGVMLICACGSTNWNALQAAARRIESVGGRILGCVLNKFSRKHRRSYYYGTYGGYYSPYRYQHYGENNPEELGQSET